jgi:hypothetical protein
MLGGRDIFFFNAGRQVTDQLISGANSLLFTVENKMGVLLLDLLNRTFRHRCRRRMQQKISDERKMHDKRRQQYKQKFTIQIFKRLFYIVTRQCGNRKVISLFFVKLVRHLRLHDNKNMPFPGLVSQKCLANRLAGILPTSYWGIRIVHRWPSLSTGC